MFIIKEYVFNVEAPSCMILKIDNVSFKDAKNIQIMDVTNVDHHLKELVIFAKLLSVKKLLITNVTNANKDIN